MRDFNFGKPGRVVNLFDRLTDRTDFSFGQIDSGKETPRYLGARFLNRAKTLTALL